MIGDTKPWVHINTGERTTHSYETAFMVSCNFITSMYLIFIATIILVIFPKLKSYPK